MFPTVWIVFSLQSTWSARGSVGAVTQPGRGMGVGVIPILTQNVGLLCGRNLLWGGGRVEGN